MPSSKPATPITARANAAVLADLPFADTTDEANARRGLIATAAGAVTADDGRVVWDFDRWGFLDGDAAAFAAFLGLMDRFEFWFDIVTP